MKIDALIARAARTQHGFTDLQRAAQEVMADPAAPDKLGLARELFRSQVYQARCVATFILGYLAAAAPEPLVFLRETVSHDPSWQVQEILAKAFDQFCADSGYERALPTIRDWLGDPHPNVRRAVTEGLRIWTARPYFKQHPDVAIALIASHHADDSEYLRKSVGNALRDISRQHPDLVRDVIATWDVSNKKAALTYKLASKFLKE